MVSTDPLWESLPLLHSQGKTYNHKVVQQTFKCIFLPQVKLKYKLAN